MQVHVIKKGESLIKIAKKYSIKDWKKGLYEHADNKAFRKKNPDPYVIQPGNKLVIPRQGPSAAEKKEEAKTQQAVVDGLARVEGIIKRLKKVKKDIDVVYGESAKESQKIYKEMNKMSSGVDVAATVLTLCVNLTKLGVQGGKIMSASAKEAAKMSDDLAKQTAKGIAKKNAKAAAYIVKDAPSGDSTAWLFTKAVADGYFKMTSPSFWAHTYVRIAKEGKSWSEAVTYDPKAEHQNAMKRLDEQRRQAHVSIDQKIKHYEALRDALKKN
jgi:hypothetical protein